MRDSVAKTAVEFAATVAKVLTDAGVKKPGEYSAVLTLFSPGPDVPPVGCSINMDEGSGVWLVSVDMVHSIQNEPGEWLNG